jgi:tetratricopeptide (TPR) repeat protein
MAATGPLTLKRVLEGAREARSNPVAAEKAILEALSLAPADIETRLGAYRFYFYNHRFSDALPHAEFIIAHAARRLNIPVDWRDVSPEDAPFDSLEPAPGLYLQALVAWGYCMMRLDEREQGAAALEKASELDPGDRFSARVILAAAAAGDDDEL